MEFPLWALFGLLAACLSATMLLIQEKIRLNGYVMAFWNKVACATFMLPLVFIFGAPSNPLFYVLLCSQAVLWVISDVIFFNAVAKVGAGMVSRLLPLSVILSFSLWFLINPSLWHDYMAMPVRSAAIFLTLCVSVFFASRLRHCEMSWQAFRMVWFVVFAAVLAPLVAKLVMGQVSAQQGPFAYVFFEALTMITLWLVYYAVKHPVPAHELFNVNAVKAGFKVGLFSCLMVATTVTAYKIVDNPGLVPAVKFTDSFLVLMYYRTIKHRENADVISGLGIVACAAIIIVLKSL